MTDYSHPKYYFVIAIIAVVLSVISGMTLPRGFFFAVLGMGIFPMIYFYGRRVEYLRDEKLLLFELGLSFLGFIFLPIGAMLGIYGSIIPTTIDLLFFIIGFSAMTISTSLLYLIEPEDTTQLLIVLTIASILLFVIIVLIKLYTWGGLMN